MPSATGSPFRHFLKTILDKHGPVDLSLSPVRVSELVHGIYRAKTPEAGQRRRQYIEHLIDLVPVHPFPARTAWLVGRIEGEGQQRATYFRFDDFMIAAAALEQDYAVLTGNIRHFRKIPGLRVVSI